ncbi:hypothetical protein SapgrDRAFT_2419 [Saprospira grandis DSM 2844]|uniref:Uncharacterized protein n=1 Tax=Saprospira grandis DSM 2844 TaxID=694433 RepID=J0P2P5_9BACT|nr:hypothetical protein SapgrDRAFT_2419 [Saprospira grandis DSM 2844]
MDSLVEKAEENKNEGLGNFFFLVKVLYLSPALKEGETITTGADWNRQHWTVGK